MTAHITYPALDQDAPVSLSAGAIKDVIRGEIGFDGVLICDDLDMKALDSYGTVSKKANAALDAGCDLGLYCAGNFDAMEELAENLQVMSSQAVARLERGAEFQKAVA